MRTNSEVKYSRNHDELSLVILCSLINEKKRSLKNRIPHSFEPGWGETKDFKTQQKITEMD